MKRTLILIVALACLLVAGCQEQQITAWMLSGADVDNESNEIVGRVGLAQGGTEIGVQSDWIGVHGERQWYGVYGAIDLPIDPNIVGQPYLGYQASVANNKEDGNTFGPILGTKYPLAKNADFAVEGWYRSFRDGSKESPVADDQWKAVAGLRYKF